MRVLLVDDEPFITQGLMLLIDWDAEGWEIAGTAKNGIEAIDILKREKIDLVLTDIRMPECDGITLLEKVKSEKFSDAYFIMMSGYDEFGYVQKAMRYGCVDYIVKPVDKDELLSAVRKVCRMERKTREDEERISELEQARGEQYSIAALIGTYDSADRQGHTIICKEIMDLLGASVEVNDKDQIRKHVSDFYHVIKEENLSKESVDFNISYLLFQLIHVASEQDDEVNQEEIMRFIGESSFEDGKIVENSEYLLGFCLEYAEYISQLRGRAAQGVLRDVEKEIRTHYADNISLREMSQKYFINSAYLGQIFKKKYSQSFKDYLTDVRIKEAAKMLSTTDKKIIIIAEEVGYKDCDYFVQKFIERMGCTPSKYRRDHT
ncbi:MAG: response regulator, partial [Lachnospiraceae bacterium]|nr:response regulator [Lachnospiraceae bacterium]